MLAANVVRAVPINTRGGHTAKMPYEILPGMEIS